jgi:hypothetical protein
MSPSASGTESPAQGGDLVEVQRPASPMAGSQAVDVPVGDLACALDVLIAVEPQGRQDGG